MPDFKITWVNHDFEPFEDSSCRVLKSKIYKALNEDAAMDLWEAEYPDSAKYGAEKCSETVDHPLLRKSFLINMPDGFTYAVPVEHIALNHAAYISKSQGLDDITKILSEVTIPEFESSNFVIHEWAAKNLPWSEVKKLAVIVKRHRLDDQMEAAWLDINSDCEII